MLTPSLNSNAYQPNPSIHSSDNLDPTSALPISDELNNTSSATSSSALPAITGSTRPRIDSSSLSTREDSLAEFVSGIDISSPTTAAAAQKVLNTMHQLQWIQPKPPHRFQSTSPASESNSTRDRSRSADHTRKGEAPKKEPSNVGYVNYKASTSSKTSEQNRLTSTTSAPLETQISTTSTHAVAPALFSKETSKITRSASTTAAPCQTNANGTASSKTSEEVGTSPKPNASRTSSRPTHAVTAALSSREPSKITRSASTTAAPCQTNANGTVSSKTSEEVGTSPKPDASGTRARSTHTAGRSQTPPPYLPTKTPYVRYQPHLISQKPNQDLNASSASLNAKATDMSHPPSQSYQLTPPRHPQKMDPKFRKPIHMHPGLPSPLPTQMGPSRSTRSDSDSPSTPGSGSSILTALDSHNNSTPSTPLSRTSEEGYQESDSSGSERGSPIKRDMDQIHLDKDEVPSFSLTEPSN